MSQNIELNRSCTTTGCNKPVDTLKCPICVKLNLPPSYYCSQECFKNNYYEHNKIHKNYQENIRRQEGLKKFTIPSFKYTGNLRPSYVTPQRIINDDNIQKPDYADTGYPVSEMREAKQKKIPIYTLEEINGTREACRLGREVLDLAGKMVKPGITTDEIDVAVHEACLERKCYPSPLNYHNFPKSCCTSVNEVICHGIPDCRPLENGDIVNIDISVYKNGYHADLNETYLVGEVEDQYKQLVKATYESMMNSIEHVKPGVMCRKFGDIIDDHVKKYKYSVVKTYCGHGVGKLFHCMPNIPHYKKNKAIGVLKPGMIFTIEPMINMGTWKDITWPFDKWTSVTADGKRSAQFEHTILVTENGYEILTARTKNSVPFWWENNNDNQKEIDAKVKEFLEANKDEKNNDNDNDIDHSLHSEENVD